MTWEDWLIAAAAAKSSQSCTTLCDPIDGSPPGSPVPGILQARTLEWAAISFSNAGKWKVKAKSLSRVWLFTTPWTAAYQAPLPMGLSRQEYWSGLPLPSLTHFQQSENTSYCHFYCYSNGSFCQEWKEKDRTLKSASIETTWNCWNNLKLLAQRPLYMGLKWMFKGFIIHVQNLNYPLC